ncbi:MAG: hypothetical protein V1744_02175 [Candidatus Altiarchaeota archaeon]
MTTRERPVDTKDIYQALEGLRDSISDSKLVFGRGNREIAENHELKNLVNGGLLDFGIQKGVPIATAPLLDEKTRGVKVEDAKPIETLDFKPPKGQGLILLYGDGRQYNMSYMVVDGQGRERELGNRTEVSGIKTDVVVEGLTAAFSHASIRTDGTIEEVNRTVDELKGVYNLFGSKEWLGAIDRMRSEIDFKSPEFADLNERVIRNPGLLSLIGIMNGIYVFPPLEGNAMGAYMPVAVVPMVAEGDIRKPDISKAEPISKDNAEIKDGQGVLVLMYGKGYPDIRVIEKSGREHKLQAKYLEDNLSPEVVIMGLANTINQMTRGGLNEVDRGRAIKAIENAKEHLTQDTT